VAEDGTPKPAAHRESQGYSQSVNLRDAHGRWARGFRFPVCRNGHPKTNDNVYVSNKGRTCKLCLKISRVKYEEKIAQRTA